MKAHIGADAESGLVHSLHTTPANESDVAHTHEVLHEILHLETPELDELSRQGVIAGPTPPSR